MIKKYSSNTQTIIVKKRFSGDKTSSYNPQNAWKIAYADFMTAMMAFFLLMWLISVSSQETLKGVAEYFTQTNSIDDKPGIGVDGGISTQDNDIIGALKDSSSSIILGSPTQKDKFQKQKQALSNISDADKESFLNIINALSNNQQMSVYSNHIQMSISDDGLHINISDTYNRSMFKINSAELEQYMYSVLNIISDLIKNQPNYIVITGHTSSNNMDVSSSDLDTWLLSAERANSVRKVIQDKLTNKDQILRIVGKSDKEPLYTRDASDPRNIRIGITLLNKDSVSHHHQSSLEALQ